MTADPKANLFDSASSMHMHTYALHNVNTATLVRYNIPSNHRVEAADRLESADIYSTAADLHTNAPYLSIAFFLRLCSVCQEMPLRFHMVPSFSIIPGPYIVSSRYFRRWACEP